MFNLEKSVAEWREQMLAAGIQTPVPLDELEAHLREEIELRTASGGTEAEAFEMAVREIGQACLLQNEFKKTDEAEKARGEERVLRLMMAVFSLCALGLAAVLLFKVGNFSQCTSTQLISCLTAVFIFVLPIWCVRLTWRVFPVIRNKQTRDAVGIAGVVVLVVWMNVFLRNITPHFDFTMGQLIVAICWGMVVPLGFWGGVAFGMEAAAQKKTGNTLLGG